jgi:hypothetical protein
VLRSVIAPGRAVVPLLIENRGAASAATDSLFAGLRVRRADGTHHTVVTTAPLSVTAQGRLSVSHPDRDFAALATAVGVLATAWRRAAAR